MKISVLGSGRWGSCIAWYLDRIGNEVVSCGLKDAPDFLELYYKHRNSYLTFPDSIEVTPDLEYAVTRAEVIVISISSQHLRSYMKDITKYNLDGKTIVLCMKGVEADTGKRLSEVVSAFVDQEKTPIAERETVETLHDRLMEIGSRLVVKTVQGIEDGSISPVPQNTEGLTPQLMQAPKLNKTNCHIDFTKSAEEVDALVRGLSPYPAALATLKTGSGETIDMKIFSTNKSSENQCGREHCSPGKARIKGKTITVCCQDGEVEITSLQPAGKKRMGAADFINGHKILTEDNNLLFI